MILRQFLHVQPVVAASYLFGCGGRQAGAVVDPVEPPEFYLGAAADVGLAIRYVIDTHVHADHRSTGRDLARASGAEYVLHAGVNRAFHLEHRDAFVDLMLQDIPPRPPEAGRIRAINLGRDDGR